MKTVNAVAILFAAAATLATAMPTAHEEPQVEKRSFKLAPRHFNHTLPNDGSAPAVDPESEPDVPLARILDPHRDGEKSQGGGKVEARSDDDDIQRVQEEHVEVPTVFKPNRNPEGQKAAYYNGI